MEAVLREFGLTNNETKIYLKLLELGPVKAGQITAKTGIHRRNVYDGIQRLLQKGLVGFTLINKQKLYSATSPEHFSALLDQEEKVLQRRAGTLAEVMPQLLLTEQLGAEKQNVTVYSGRRGLINILEDIVRTGKENCVYSTSEVSFLEEYLELFHEKRVKAKVKDKIILNAEGAKRAKKLTGLPYTEVRVMPREFDSPLAINVYGDKVGILIMTENPLAILIEDERVAAAFRKYFAVLWGVARPFGLRSRRDSRRAAD